MTSIRPPAPEAEHDLDNAAAQTPALEAGHYLDNAATTKPCAEAVEAALDMMRRYGNPSSSHRLGLAAEQALRLARRQVAEALHSAPEQVTFTGSGTEASNLALLGLADRRRGGRIVATDAEHPAVRNTLLHLERQGFELVLLSTAGGCPDLEQAARAIDQNTALVTAMMVNNETGAIFPVAELGRMAQQAGARFHIDAVQGFGKLPFDPKAVHCDTLAVSAHKIGGLKGVGALWRAERLHLPPQIHGGGQEGNLRSGTENMPGIAAFGAAVVSHAGHYDPARIKALSDLAAQRLQALGCVLNRPPQAVPDILNISVPGHRAEPVLTALSRRGVYLSAGSACSAKSKRHSSVLAAMGLKEELLASALRISFGVDSTEADVDALVEGVNFCMDTLVREE